MLGQKKNWVNDLFFSIELVYVGLLVLPLIQYQSGHTRPTYVLYAKSLLMAIILIIFLCFFFFVLEKNYSVVAPA